MISVEVDEVYAPQSVAWSLRHMDEVEVEVRADITHCLALLPPSDAALLHMYAAGYSAREALKLLHQRGDPHKRFRSSLGLLVRLLNGGRDANPNRNFSDEPDRSDRAAVGGEDDARAGA